jgi:hypothetical protein
LSSFNKCNTILNAVFLPIPGSRVKASTASSINLEENIIPVSQCDGKDRESYPQLLSEISCKNDAIHNF